MLLAITLVVSDPELLTVAEASDYTATARYDEVVALLDRIEAQSPIMRRAELGVSHEGRTIPLAILTDPPVANAHEARASGKVIVYAFGNIHAGEVCGKEALLMLCRELALRPDHELFDDIVLVLCPIYNADGNEKMSVDNRPGQVGPAKGMGQRPNGQGLDLNRDHVKLESPEARAQAAFLTEWDPHVVIDTHTTNGSRHRYTVTYAAPLNPSVHAGSAAFVRDELLPDVSARLEERTGYGSFFYGNFDRERTIWHTYSPMPRYGGNYRGLRGHMSILSEAYAYAPYRDRVLVTLEFVREILGFVAEHPERVIELHERARHETIERGRQPQPDDLVGIRHRPAARPEPAIIRTYVGDTDEPQDLSVVHVGGFEPTRSVRRPHAYVLGPDTPAAVLENLAMHGIAVEPFQGAARVEVYTIAEIDRSQRPFQGHHLVSVEADARLETLEVPPGAHLVPTAQPLGTLAVYLLEPESEDGLVAWNFFDEVLEEGRGFPVMRVRDPSDLHRMVDPK